MGRQGRPSASDPWGVGSFFPVPRPPYVCAVSWATWLLFTGVPAWFVVLRLRCPGPLGSCSPVRPLGVLCCLCGVLGHLAPVHRCARSVCCFACAVSWATWLLFTGVPTRSVVLRVRCPGPLGSCSPVCPLGGSDFFLLTPGVLVDQASRTKEKGSKIPKITSENALNLPKTSSSVHRSLSHCRYS